jgi:hypothetical protein
MRVADDDLFEMANLHLRTTLKLTVAAVALFAAVASAEADMHVTATYGAWRVSEGLNDRGAPMCIAALLGADRAFLVKVQGDGFFLHTFKDGWQIPVGQSVDVTLQVDRAPPMSFVGSGLPASSHNFGGFEISIAPDAVWPNTGRSMISELVNLLADGQQLHLYFPDGTEQPWEGSLTGSEAALIATRNCVGRIVTAAHPTQPFGASPPAGQSLGPAPPQPFGAYPAGPGASGTGPK